MTLFVSIDAATRRRLDVARAWLTEPAAGRGVPEVLIVATTRGAADELLAHPDDPYTALEQTGRLGAHRRTPGQLAAELAVRSLARDGRIPLAGLAVEALAARALASCRDERDLEYFHPVADTPGMPRTLARTLLELRAHEVTPEALEARGGPPGRDLARLLCAWLAELDARGLDDPAGVMRRATSTLRREPPAERRHPLVGLPLLLLDPAPTAPVEAALLAALAASSPRALATLPTADREALERLREATAAIDHPLEILVHAPSPDERDQDPQGLDDDDLFGGLLDATVAATPRLERRPETRLDAVRRRLFQPIARHAPHVRSAEDDGAKDDSKPLDDASIVVWTAAGEGRECTEIARRLHQLARDGLPFDRVAVALRDPDTYLPLLEEAFGRAGIPAHCTRGSRRPDPAGRALLALLACADERLSAARFAEYLSLGQAPPVDATGAPAPPEEVPWVTPEGDQLVFKALLSPEAPEEPESAPLDPDVDDFETPAPVVAGTLRVPRQWQRLLVDAHVIEGRERWRRRLRGVENELKLRLRALDDDEPVERKRLQAQLRRVRDLAAFALPVVDALAALPESARWGAWLEALEELAALTLRRPERVLEVLAELRPMAEVGPVGLGEVRGALEERLATLRAEPRGRRWGRVFVCALEELRGRSFDTVFVPALAEGRFPRRVHEDPLLLDAHRRAVAPTLPTRRRRAARERLLLHLAVGAAESTLGASWPSLDAAEGRARVPSFYALDLLRAAEGELPDVRALERRAALASAARLGWPAPRDPSTAIDAAEYDLAVLADLIARRDEAPVGSARYLLDVNPRLRRALRNRYCRWESRKLTRADGLVDPDEATLEALRRHLPTERSYSPTALQTFAACPLRFALYALHGLREREAPARLEQMDPLTRGSLFHEVQFELLVELRREGLLPIDEATRGEADIRLDAALDRVAARYEDELAPAVPRIWRAEIESLRIDLHGWIDAVVAEGASRDGATWTPSRFELAFGLTIDSERADSEHDAASREEEAVIDGGRRLRGSIDLLESAGGGGNDVEGMRLRVTDHKTGRPPRAVQRSSRGPRGSGLRVGGGEVLQPLLYALAVESMSEPDGSSPGDREALAGRVESGRLFYCTRRGGYRSIEVPLDDEGRRAVDQVLGTVAGALEHGVLPAAPREDACRWCDFRPICGDREERRVARKRTDRLAPLARLRSLP